MRHFCTYMKNSIILKKQNGNKYKNMLHMIPELAIIRMYVTNV